MSWKPIRFTGGEIEEEVIGHALVSWDGNYVPFNRSMMVVKAHQPWDPSDPEPRFASDLHASVALALNLDDWSELRFYTAVGSPLDFFHGIDCFFEFRGLIVTIDLTVDPKKLVGKADLVLNVSDQSTAVLVGAAAVARQMTGGAA